MAEYHLSYTAEAIDDAIGAVIEKESTWDSKLDATARAKSTSAIPFAAVDSTSTSTAFTATIPGITAYEDGLCVMLKNGVVTSASNFTVNINGLGAKKVYTNLAAATLESTKFNANYTMLFVYDSTRVSGGAWVLYNGYDSNTNTIGYQLRSNHTTRKTLDACRYYKIFFTSADGQAWVPSSANTVNDATKSKVVNQRPIDPFGPIVYTSANTNYAANANIAATTIWQQYNVTLGHAFNWTNSALTLTSGAPVYVKCAPQSNGSAIMDSTTPIVQSLPSTEDGKIYIFLGVASAATTMELWPTHPVYYFKDGAIRIWTNAPASSGGGGIPHIACDGNPITDSAIVTRFTQMLDEASNNGYSTVSPFAWFTFSRYNGSGWVNVTSAVCQSGGVRFDPPGGDWVLQLNGNQLELIYDD